MCAPPQENGEEEPPAPDESVVQWDPKLLKDADAEGKV